MKKMNFLLLVIVLFSSLSFISVDKNNKAVESFQRMFKNYPTAKWVSSAKGYTVSFDNKGVNTIINYDTEGNITGTRRYYGEDLLPLKILLKVKTKYPGEKIALVTEVMEDESVVYGIRLDDETNTTVLEVSEQGSVKQVQKFERQKAAQ